MYQCQFWARTAPAEGTPGLICRYGSLEDSAENCKHLIPKPPKKDFYKLINKSKIVLRFGVRFEDSPGHKVSEDHRSVPTLQRIQQHKSWLCRKFLRSSMATNKRNNVGISGAL